MGTDVDVRGNHSIDFEGRRLVDVAPEIIDRLNSVVFTEREISAVSAWDQKFDQLEFFLDEDNDTANYLKLYGNCIEDGPHILVDQYQCDFSCGFRYKTWCTTPVHVVHDWRKTWRSYFYKAITALGGDRVIYLADNGHILEAYDYSESLEKIESHLLETLGPPANTLIEAYENAYAPKSGKYYIDHFKDIVASA